MKSLNTKNCVGFKLTWQAYMVIWCHMQRKTELKTIADFAVCVFSDELWHHWNNSFSFVICYDTCWTLLILDPKIKICHILNRIKISNDIKMLCDHFLLALLSIYSQNHHRNGWYYRKAFLFPLKSYIGCFIFLAV